MPNFEAPSRSSSSHLKLASWFISESVLAEEGRDGRFDDDSSHLQNRIFDAEELGGKRQDLRLREEINFSIYDIPH